MFGLSTFAQAPYASLGGTKYDVAVGESVTLTDSYAMYAAFAGVVNDSISITDDVASSFNFYLTNAETFNLTEDEAGTWDTYAANDESLTQIGRAHV